MSPREIQKSVDYKLAHPNETTRPNHIELDHWHEWVNLSVVDPLLTFLNVVSLTGLTTYEYLLYGLPNSERRNDGRLRDKWLNRYQHLEAGGWWVSGLDPLNNWQPMEWGRCKPDFPRLDGSKKNKPIKYESPPKVANRLTYFDVPSHIWAHIAQRYNIKRYHSSFASGLADQINSEASVGEGASLPFNGRACVARQRREGSGERNIKTTLNPYPLTFSPDLTEINWTKTSDRTNFLIFWEWLQQHPSIPIILTEGEKKAGCLLSMGFATIALPGIWGGRVGSKHNELLHPDLLPLAQQGRKFIILFDYETKPKTKYNIYQAILRTGEAILKAGCQCEVALLPGPEKGVDDFVASRGLDASTLLTSIIDDALSLAEYKRVCYPRPRGLSSKYPANVELNTRYLSKEILVKGKYGDLDWVWERVKGERLKDVAQNSATLHQQQTSILELGQENALQEKGLSFEACTFRLGVSSKACKPRNEKEDLLNLEPFPFPLSPSLLPSEGLVILASGMGTGKTELMALFRQLNPQMRFLNLGHRINLLKNVSERLNTQMYSDLEQGKYAEALALSITIDSLYKLQNQLVEYGCVFIDEACQYLAHLLHSKTCKEHRALILEVLEYIISKARLVVLADAHMDDVTVDFFRAMRPYEEKPFIIKNNYRQGGREVYLYETDDSTTIVLKIFTALMLGQKIMVVSDSKKFIKKLEAAMTVRVFEDEGVGGRGDLCPSGYEESLIINNLFLSQSLPLPVSESPRLRIWSIHAENSGSEENIAFIKDISSSVKNVDALLASPSLGTGVDIPNYHFDAVFGAFHAVSQTATECAQALHRYRPQVPLHIWVAPRPPFGYKETNAAKIKERMLQLNEMTAFLIRIDKETGKRGAEKDWALDAYCQIEANRNRSINNLRDDLRSLLTEMEYNIIPVLSESDPSIKAELKEAGLSLDTAYNRAVARASNISSNEYLNRQSKNYLSPEEVVECQKYRIQRDYGMPVTEELVLKDDGGHLISKLIALEAILAPSSGEIVDPTTGRKYPAPPQIVAQRDLKERDNLPLCMDWHNYSGKWLARHILGLPKILTRLLAAEEVTSIDPDLVKMTEMAIASRAHIKAILGFTISPKCTPIWLLSTLLDQLGLKMTSRRKGGKGQQVRYYSLTVEETSFAIDVLQHRERQREEKAQNERERLEKERIHQARMQNLYGIDPPAPPIVTPPQKRDIYTDKQPLTTNQEGVEPDSLKYKDSFPPTLEKLKPCFGGKLAKLSPGAI